MPPLFSGEDIWCQGFSEPGAGSDLASVQTFAERKGDKWVINGHKVWTSLAHFAEWMILLLRTDKSHKYDGLSYFVVPIRSALGLECSQWYGRLVEAAVEAARTAAIESGPNTLTSVEIRVANREVCPIVEPEPALSSATRRTR